MIITLYLTSVENLAMEHLLKITGSQQGKVSLTTCKFWGKFMTNLVSTLTYWH